MTVKCEVGPVTVPTNDPTEAAASWRRELSAILSDIDAGDYESVSPQRLPVELGPIPEELTELANLVVERIGHVTTLCRSRLCEIDSELRGTTSRGPRRWAHSSPAPSRLDTSA